jgi:hypothetical protein
VHRSYIISICGNRENIEFYYHHLNNQNILVSYRLTNFLIGRITDSNRGIYYEPKTRQKKLNMELKVLGSVMLNNCEDIMSGDNI